MLAVLFPVMADGIFAEPPPSVSIFEMVLPIISQVPVTPEKKMALILPKPVASVLNATPFIMLFCTFAVVTVPTISIPRIGCALYETMLRTVFPVMFSVVIPCTVIPAV